MSDHHHHYRRETEKGHGSSLPPPLGSIQQGQVVRIEAYGAFVQLEGFFRQRGLVHISQLASVRVDSVQDVVEIGDHVWVKVVQVEQLQPETNGQHQQQPPRFKINLSLKDVPQDGTALEVHYAEEQAKQVSQSLEQSLNSTIGMAIARDPMAAGNNNSRLVLKNQQQQPKIINGYALLEDDDDNENEHNPVRMNTRQEASIGGVNGSGPGAAQPPPLGRGRSATLPAWLVAQQQDAAGPTGLPFISNRKDDLDPSGSDDSLRDKRNGKKEKHKRHHKSRNRSSRKESSTRRRRRNGADSDDDSDRQRKSRSSKKRRPRRSRSGSVERSGSRDGRLKRAHRSKIRSQNESSDDDSHRRRTRGDKDGERKDSNHREKRIKDKGGSSSDDSQFRFQTVDEARRVVCEIESRRKNREEKHLR